MRSYYIKQALRAQYNAAWHLKRLGMRNAAADALKAYRALCRMLKADNACEAAGLEAGKLPTELLHTSKVRVQDL